MTTSTFMSLVFHISQKSGIRILVDHGNLCDSYMLDHRVRSMIYGDYCAFYISPDVERDLEQVVINMNHTLCTLSYFRVLMHELAHATGKSSIFARPGVTHNSKSYDYYRNRIEEELIADTAAMLLVREFGLSNPELEAHHLRYLHQHMECLYVTNTTMSINPEVRQRAVHAAEYIRDNWLIGFNIKDNI